LNTDSFPLVAEDDADMLQPASVRAKMIEDVLGVSDKGEDAIQALERDLPKLKATDVKAKFPAIGEFLDWLKS
jgi:hypothetical protein